MGLWPHSEAPSFTRASGFQGQEEPTGGTKMTFTMQDAIEEKWTDWPMFHVGYREALEGKQVRFVSNGVEGQAYDRGYEVGMNERNTADPYKKMQQHQAEWMQTVK
jgi:hypothetical protein